MFNVGTLAAAAQPWTPALLFKKGEQGVWYDPSDIERYMAKGPECLDNGDFGQGATGWAVSGSDATHVITFANGTVRYQSDTTSPVLKLEQLGRLVVGKTYEVVTVVSAWTSGSIKSDNLGGVVLASGGGTSRAVGVATSTVFSIIRSTTNVDLTIESISVRELPQLGTATMFQDAMGTLPVTAVEQPVGLILDKRLGLVRGSELVVNSTLDDGLAGWGAMSNGTTTTPVAGAVDIAQTATGATTFTFQTVNTVIGRWYECAFEVEALSTQCEFFVGVWDTKSKTMLKALAAGARTMVYFRFNAESTGPEIRWGLSAYNTAGAQGRFYLASIRELPGNHASQVTTTARPILSARKNIFLTTHDLTHSSWVAIAADKLGVGEGVKLTFTGSNAYLYRSVSSLLPPGVVTLSMVQYGSTQNVGALYCTAAAGGAKTAVFSFVGDGAVTSVTSGASASIKKLDEGKYFVSLTFESAQTGNAGFFLSSSVAGESIVLVSPQIESRNTATRYQRVNTATDYDTVGFPHYLRFDGVDDYLVTQSIDFTGTDKVASVAGVTNLSDATRAIVFELSSSYANPGTFAIQYPSVEGVGTALFASNGTSMAFASAATGKAAFTAVISGRGDIAGDVASARVNGAISVTSSADQGAGNYGNYPMYICSRSVAAQKFNGYLYQLGIRGAATTDDLIRAWEKAVAKKTGVNL